MEYANATQGIQETTALIKNAIKTAITMGNALKVNANAFSHTLVKNAT